MRTRRQFNQMGRAEVSHIVLTAGVSMAAYRWRIAGIAMAYVTIAHLTELSH